LRRAGLSPPHLNFRLLGAIRSRLKLRCWADYASLEFRHFGRF